MHTFFAIIGSFLGFSINIACLSVGIPPGNCILETAVPQVSRKNYIGKENIKQDLPQRGKLYPDHQVVYELFIYRVMLTDDCS